MTTTPTTTTPAPTKRTALPPAQTASIAPAPSSVAPVPTTEEAAFDKSYATTVTADIVDDIATADERFSDRPELGAATTMGFLSHDMERLLNAGIPPVKDKAAYYALVTTLGQFYGKARDQLPYDVLGAAANYSVAREQTRNLLAILNPLLGKHYSLPTWSYM
ncbi:MAG: hypothetical protein ABI083_20495 [Lapillicoccus sp.]